MRTEEIFNCAKQLARVMTKRAKKLFTKDCVIHDIEELLTILAASNKRALKKMGYKTDAYLGMVMHGGNLISRFGILDYPKEHHKDVQIEMYKAVIEMLEKPENCLHRRNYD